MSKSIPFISVIILGYNYEKEITKTLDALAVQTFQDFEIVFVNNGSSDHTEAVVQDYMQRHPELRFQYLWVEKDPDFLATLPKGRNAGLRAAKGVYLTFHDQDDRMDPNCLELLAQKAKATNADRVYGNHRYIKNGKCVHLVSYSANASKWFVLPWHGTIYKSSIIHENDIQIPYGEDDTWFSLEFAYYAKDYKAVNACIYSYLVHEDSASGTKTINTLEKARVFYQHTYEKISSLYQRVQAPEDKMMLEYLNLKYFYNQLYHYGQNCPFRDVYREYRQLKSLLLKDYPSVFKNKNLKLFHDNQDTGYARFIIGLSARLERWHMYPLALRVYHLLSKVISFVN